MSLSTAVIGSLEGLTLRQCDNAAAELALTYADQIDEGGDIGRLGPPLLAALEALGMTPRARAALIKKGEADGPRQRSPLDELRERRERRTG